MDEIRITLAELSDTAAQMRNYNATLNSTLDEILSFVKKTMNDLQVVWESDGEFTLLNAFNKFSTKFIEESEVIESYARFLDDTVNNYDSLESTIVSNATNFD